MWLLDGTLKNTFKLHSNCVQALDADNQHALSSGDAKVKLFNDGAPSHTTQALCALALLPDGLRFVSGSYDMTARIAYHGLAPIRI